MPEFEERKNYYDLRDDDELKPSISRLAVLGIVYRRERTRGTRHFMAPPLLRATGLDLLITLERVEPHRLAALVAENVQRYPDSTVAEIHRRVGPKLAQRTIQRTLKRLVDDGRISAENDRRWSTSRPAESIRHNNDDGG